VDAVCSEIVAKQDRIESILEDAMGAFHVTSQRLSYEGTEERKEKQRQMQAMQRLADAEVQKKVQRRALCERGEILLQRFAHKNKMQEKTKVHRPFHHWGQLTALGLLYDAIQGNLNGTTHGSERISLIPLLANRLVKETGPDGVARNVPVLIGGGSHYMLSPPMRKGIVGSRPGPPFPN
jgi:hypothetical protein